MKQGTGNSKIAGVELGELQVDFFAPRMVLNAKLALVDAEGRRGYGYTNRNVWGPEVQAALQTLREAMETEAAAALFEGVAGSTPLIEQPKQEEEGPPSL